MSSSAQLPAWRSRQELARLIPLCIGQGVAAIGLAAGGTAGSLLAKELTGSLASAPIPLGLLVSGAAIAGPALTATMHRHGRTRGLTVAYGVATLGAGAVLMAGVGASFPLLLVGSFLLGVGNTGVMLGRYVAADAVPPARRGWAMSVAMTSVAVGAVSGPALLGPVGSLASSIGLPATTGLYLVAVVAFPAAALLTIVLHGRRVRLDDEGSAPLNGPAPENSTPWRTPRGGALALTILAVANLTMVVLMGVVPAHLNGHGWGLGGIGLLAAAHIGAMYGWSPVSGWLHDRRGPMATALLGAALSLVATVLTAAMAGHPNPVVVVSMMLLLGAGWNLQFIGGSGLLTAATPAGQRPRAEGRGELAMGGGAAVGCLVTAGPLLAVGGLTSLAVALAGLIAVSAVPALLAIHTTSKLSS